MHIYFNIFNIIGVYIYYVQPLIDTCVFISSTVISHGTVVCHTSTGLLYYWCTVYTEGEQERQGKEGRRLRTQMGRQRHRETKVHGTCA